LWTVWVSQVSLSLSLDYSANNSNISVPPILAGGKPGDRDSETFEHRAIEPSKTINDDFSWSITNGVGLYLDGNIILAGGFDQKTQSLRQTSLQKGPSDKRWSEAPSKYNLLIPRKMAAATRKLQV
jgi:hypothetical protein